MFLCDGKSLHRRLVLLYDVVLANMNYLPGTVDVLLDYEAVELNEKTVSWLYSDFTPLRTRYKKGSRPYLERIVRKLVKKGMSPRARMERIVNWVADRRQWPPRRKSLPFFMGGTEEEIIQKGGGQCNETARVLSVLLQIAGVPSRQCGHWQGSFDAPRVGHMTNEVYVDGKWCYVDATRAVMFPLHDGSLASAWELRQDRGIIRCAPDRLFMGPTGELDPKRTRQFYLDLFHPKNITTITNYQIEDAHLYNYDWEESSEFMKERVRTQAVALANRLRQRLGLPKANRPKG